MYRVGDFVFFEASATTPYQIRRIDELNKTPTGAVEAKVTCYYRRRDISSNLIQQAEKYYFQETDSDPQTSADANGGGSHANSLTDIQRHQIKHRELFLSRQVECLPATHIRGKCSVTLYNDVEPLTSYVQREDAFYYRLIYDPSTKRLQEDRGSMRIGSDYQSEIQPLLKKAGPSRPTTLAVEPASGAGQSVSASDLPTYVDTVTNSHERRPLIVNPSAVCSDVGMTPTTAAPPQKLLPTVFFDGTVEATKSTSAELLMTGIRAYLWSGALTAALNPNPETSNAKVRRRRQAGSQEGPLALGRKSINAYASSNTGPEEVKNKFYEDLHALLAIVLKVGKLIVIGSRKTCDGTELDAREEVLGSRGIEGYNGNGHFLLTNAFLSLSTHGSSAELAAAGECFHQVHESSIELAGGEDRVGDAPLPSESTMTSWQKSLVKVSAEGIEDNVSEDLPGDVEQ
nr:unnamed protein product [Spirometra erinaceieuropaei]